MTKTDFHLVDEYMAAQTEASRAVLERVRGAIRKAVPHAVETVSYRIPTYKLDGRAVIYFAAWKRHYSIYPATRLVLDTLAGELAPYDVSKGTIRFPLSGRVPVALIGRIAKLRAGEVARSKAKPKV